MIEAFRISGLTGQAFSEQVGIHPTTLSGWLKEASRSTAHFTEVSIPISPPAPIEVDLPNGVRIRVRTTGDVSRTAELIRGVVAPLKGGA